MFLKISLAISFCTCCSTPLQFYPIIIRFNWQHPLHVFKRRHFGVLASCLRALCLRTQYEPKLSPVGECQERRKIDWCVWFIHSWCQLMSRKLRVRVSRDRRGPSGSERKEFPEDWHRGLNELFQRPECANKKLPYCMQANSLCRAALRDSPNFFTLQRPPVLNTAAVLAWTPASLEHKKRIVWMMEVEALPCLQLVLLLWS